MFTKKLVLAAALLGALAASSVTVADDSESKTLLKNFYQQYSLVGCDGVVSCVMDFPATTDATTVVTAVSCYFFATPGTQAIVAMGTTHNKPQFLLQPFLIGVTGNLNVGVNATTNLFVTKGDSVYIQVYSIGGTNEQQMSCTISGYHS
jgi:hypothetical protein